MDTKVEREARGRVYAGLRGEVVEIGFGSGLTIDRSQTDRFWSRRAPTQS